MIDLRLYPVGTKFKTRCGDTAKLSEVYQTENGFRIFMKIKRSDLSYIYYTDGTCPGIPEYDILNVLFTFIND